MTRFLALTLVIGLTGCIPLRSKDTTHTIILGFGIVSVSRSNKELATVVRATSVGMLVSDLPGPKVAIGLASSTVVTVSATNNLLIEASQKPLGPLKVAVP